MRILPNSSGGWGDFSLDAERYHTLRMWVHMIALDFGSVGALSEVGRVIGQGTEPPWRPINVDNLQNNFYRKLQKVLF